MGKYEIINLIRDDREKIEERITKLSEQTKENFYVTVEVMTETWVIKSKIDWLKKWLHNAYFIHDEITRGQYNLVYAYLKNYEDSVWSRLYDIAAANDTSK